METDEWKHGDSQDRTLEDEPADSDEETTATNSTTDTATTTDTKQASRQ
ncbi:hypothetical protein [Haloarcula sediminis]|nr:hypothetical protein [Haloarcula sp. CK38]